MNKVNDKVIIANMSGYYGDRLAAAHEMVTGGPIDYLTGDYLAELTMAILYKSRLKQADGGYARSFLLQMEQIMGTCLDRDIKVVVNAGGLNPGALAGALQQLAAKLQLHPRIAWIEGDDLMPRLRQLQQQGEAFRHLDTGRPLAECGMPPVTANAYLGCWGIVEALRQGAQIVITGRVADTSLVMGPAAYHFGWARDQWDALAGAAAAGHIIECSGQATGGNYAFIEEVPTFKKLGFPLAEIAEDGSAIITKHPGTGGLVSVGTVTAQLLYEVGAPAYITPDVVAHFDSLQLQQVGENRVKVSGTKGSPATNEAKVTINCHGGFQNSLTFYTAGLDMDKKVAIIRQAALESFGGEEVFAQLDFRYYPTHKENPATYEESLARLQISVVDADAQKAGKFFTASLAALALSNVPGIFWAQPPGPARPRIVHFPALIHKRHLCQQVHLGEETIEVEEVQANGEVLPVSDQQLTSSGKAIYNGKQVRIPFGRLFGARSGDKGGNANLGVWAREPEAYRFLRDFLTVERLKQLMPEAAPYEVQRYDFPNLLGLNFFLQGFLDEGVGATFRLDKQAKALGEYLRAKFVHVPVELTKDKG